MKTEFQKGYRRGVDDALMRVSNWVDEETVQYVRDILLGGVK